MKPQLPPVRAYPACRVSCNWRRLSKSATSIARASDTIAGAIRCSGGNRALTMVISPKETRSQPPTRNIAPSAAFPRDGIGQRLPSGGNLGVRFPPTTTKTVTGDGKTKLQRGRCQRDSKRRKTGSSWNSVRIAVQEIRKKLPSSRRRRIKVAMPVALASGTSPRAGGNQPLAAQILPQILGIS
jgi:hypothetical protein